MKAILILYDSLRRCTLPSYGDAVTYAPNFTRLAEKSAVFDHCYVGSLPCMPARRELHTGRYNFLHCGWGPLEPFDDSMPEMLKKAGIHTHLVTDHGHYFEDAGHGYHTKYKTWELVRGQEGDPWKGDLDPEIRPSTQVPVRDPAALAFRGPLFRQDAVNRKYMPDVSSSAENRVFDGGLEFIDTNHGYDNWFLQIESFDPHEPFYTFEEFLQHYELPDVGKDLDWPPYDRVYESPEVVEHLKARYRALVSQCDMNLGRVLDRMDRYDLWKDTLLIVCTDHGYLLGEHGWWAKNNMPCFDEIVHTPLFIADPRAKEAAGTRRNALVQTIDLAPTLLEYFGVPQTERMQGRPLKDAVASDTPVHDYALFGHFGRQLCITDGRYVYMPEPHGDEAPVYSYTLQAGGMKDVLKKAELSAPLPFTKGMPVLKIPQQMNDSVLREYGELLFDLKNDPDEEQNLQDPDMILKMRAALVKKLKESDAPEEVYRRFRLTEI